MSNNVLNQAYGSSLPHESNSPQSIIIDLESFLEPRKKSGQILQGKRSVIFKRLTPDIRRFGKKTLRIVIEDTATKTLITRTVNAILGRRSKLYQLITEMVPGGSSLLNSDTKKLQAALSAQIGAEFVADCSPSPNGLYTNINSLSRL